MVATRAENILWLVPNWLSYCLRPCPLLLPFFFSPRKVPYFGRLTLEFSTILIILVVFVYLSLSKSDCLSFFNPSFLLFFSQMFYLIILLFRCSKMGLFLTYFKATQDSTIPKSKLFNKNSILKTYRSMVLPVLLNEYEAWFLLLSE